MRKCKYFSVVVIAVSGCALPQHSNTLLFATNTTVAFDVSANATTAAPNITIGYKRQEMAWVPLLANKSGPKDERQPAECPPASKVDATYDCIFLGRDGASTDAYSVLATFSGMAAASGSAGSATPSTSANGSIAQYFATGLAARVLADKGGAQLVNTGSPTPDAVISAWSRNQQEDEQKLGTYFNDAAKFSQQRDLLVDASAYKSMPVAKSLKQQADVLAFLNYSRVNFLLHGLASAIPSAGPQAPPAVNPQP